ncbi:unnamed protein product [Ectocarpus sp. 4 AP-2014]
MRGVDACTAGAFLALMGVTQGFVPYGTPAIRSAAATLSSSRASESTRRARKETARPTFSILQMHQVTIEHEGTSTVLEVDENTTILEAALDNDVDLPHDCKLGVCLTCPSKVVSGEVDQSDGTLEDSVTELGYALTCCTYARSDVTIRSVEEDELVGAQFSDRS